jgi:hypothetical protein
MTDGRIAVNGSLITGGTTTNSGTVAINGYLGNTGTFTNLGNLTNNAVLLNWSTFLNNGTILNYHGIDAAPAGQVFTNTGTIRNAPGRR